MPLVTISRRNWSRSAPEPNVANDALEAAGPASPVVAAAASAAHVDTAYVVSALVILAVGAAVGAYLAPRAVPIALKPGVSVFAVFYIFAQALERSFELLQLLWPSLGKTKVDAKPATKSVGKREAVDQRDQMLAAAINQGSESAAKAAASAQTAVDQVRLNRALLAWTINSALAMAGAGWLGLRLIAAISTPEWPNSSVDVILTGLVIGGGTKPLHDLIANLQAAKKKTEDPAPVDSPK